MTDSLPLLPVVCVDLPEVVLRALAQEGLSWCPYNPRQSPGHGRALAARSDAVVPSLADFDETTHQAAGGRFVLFDARRSPCPPLVPGQTALDLSSLFQGAAASELAQLEQLNSRRTSWTCGGLELVEEVAAVDRYQVRRRWLSRLRGLLERAGGLWAVVAPCPFPYRTAFNLRLDHDRLVESDFRAVQQACAGQESAVSHFLCASTHETHPQLLEELRGHDVGSHGYWHHTYRTAAENRQNIERGIRSLRAIGLSPAGFVAPHGRYHAGLRQALEAVQPDFSGEFAWAYDDWPGYPPQSRVLQVPVHPLCLGLFLEAAQRAENCTADQAARRCADYFVQAAQELYRAGRPLFFYGHPDGRLGRYPYVLRQLLAEVGGYSALWRTTQRQMAEWWHCRQRLRPRIWQQGDLLRAELNCLPSRYTAALQVWQQDRVASMALEPATTIGRLSRLSWEERTEPDLPRGTPVVGRTGWREPVRRYLDWEVVTPLPEIRRDSLRGWLKHALRSVRQQGRRSRVSPGKDSA